MSHEKEGGGKMIKEPKEKYEGNYLGRIKISKHASGADAQDTQYRKIKATGPSGGINIFRLILVHKETNQTTGH